MKFHSVLGCGFTRRTAGLLAVASPMVLGLMASGLVVSGALDRALVQAADDLPPIVFVTRQFTRVPDIEERNDAIEQASIGRLMLREGNEETVLVDSRAPDAAADTPRDVSDPSVSADGQRIVFAGYSPVDEAWRIYEINADGSGLNKVTTSDLSLDLSRHGVWTGSSCRPFGLAR